MTLTLEPMGIVLVQVILSSSVRRFSFPQLWRLFEMFSAKVLIRPSCSWGEISGLHLSEAFVFPFMKQLPDCRPDTSGTLRVFFFFKDHKLCHHAPSGLLVLLRSSVHLFFYRMHRVVKFCLSERFIWAFEPLLVFISSFIYTDIFLGCCIHSRYYVSFIYHDNETGLSWPWNCLSVHRLVIFSLWTSGTVYKVVIITTQLIQYLTPWIKQKVCTWITFRLFDFNCGSVQNYKNWFTIEQIIY